MQRNQGTVAVVADLMILLLMSSFWVVGDIAGGKCWKLIVIGWWQIRCDKTAIWNSAACDRSSSKTACCVYRHLNLLLSALPPFPSLYVKSGRSSCCVNVILGGGAGIDAPGRCLVASVALVFEALVGGMVFVDTAGVLGVGIPILINVRRGDCNQERG